jgi:surface polysaccharide O-acyltransferase-like enzyme
MRLSSPEPLARPAPAAPVVVDVPAISRPRRLDVVPALQPRVTLAVRAVRLASVERLRVLAMLEIVRFHDHEDRLPWLGGLGLPAFLLVTNLFNCTLTERRGIAKFLVDKRERLFLPWVFWSFVYAAVIAVDAWLADIRLADVLSWDMLLAGTAPHLWFVPFAMFSAGLVGGAQYYTRELSDRVVAYVAAIGGACLLLAIGFYSMGPELPAPAPQWLLSISSSFFGFALGRLVIGAGGKLEFTHALPIAVFALVAAVVFECWQSNMLIWRYGVSLLLVVLAFQRPGKLDPLTRFVSPLLFGIYLVHPLVGHRLLVKIPGLEASQLRFVADFIVTALLVYGLRFTPLKRFV